MSVDSTKSRGNFCIKAFEIKQKTLDEIKTYCSRFSSTLMTNDLLNNQNSTLEEELQFIIEKKLKLSELSKTKIYGLNLDLKGNFARNDKNMNFGNMIF